MSENDQTAGCAIAAFTLAQFAFWGLVKAGFLPKAEAEQMLQQGIEANQHGGQGNAVAAGMLAEALRHIQAYETPAQH